MCIQLTWNVEYLPPNKCAKFHFEEIQYLVMYYVLSIRPEAFQKFYTVLSSVDNLRLAGGQVYFQVSELQPPGPLYIASSSCIALVGLLTNMQEVKHTTKSYRPSTMAVFTK